MMTKMKMVLATGAVLGCLNANALILDFSNVENAAINFDGASHFTFSDGILGKDFNITTAGSSAVGFLGNISGTFTIGAVSGIGAQTAPVTGLGTLTIDDGATPWSATLDWNKIGRLGAGNILNVDGVLNLSSISYAGSNADLLALSAQSVGQAVVTFQFTSSSTANLNFLKTHVVNASYSGTLTTPTVPDAGGTLALLGAIVCGFGLMQRRNS